ncbi:phosphate signaling complex protein PhoU [Clostridioides mangenotii]|uniref:phosphate signaling complex protein PhoU n=1 Tax=Metaclostridioides mangenotii TaxID=1540 RepID=UPI001C127CA2|nr:phosphate signaling complex protein PhoU [Clostridioides mangenotii]MBU5307105.1 phosphate signaling complex protein PhoU [Clostridioides mangenotii]MCR1953887.1 phosphate signaling complex protein PhoU [Clostridioides mangenotii]
MKNNSLDISIDNLKEYIINMMEKCEEAITKSVTCMVNKDLEGAKEVIKDDEVINGLREQIRDKSIELTVLKQPMARDLRIIYAFGNIAVELERIGDYAANISKEMIEIGSEAYIKDLIDIPKMSKVCVEMMEQTKQSLETLDTKLAYSIGDRDDEVDYLYTLVKRDSLGIMHRKPETIDQGVKLLFIGRYLERIGDHITNICEQIIYAVDGDMVEIG